MKQKFQLVLYVLFGLMFINSGLNKIFQYMPMPKDLPEKMVKFMGSFMEIGWLLPTVAIVEIIGGMLILTKRFRLVGALMLLPILTGIIITHSVAAPSGLPIALAFLAIEIWVLWDGKKQLTGLLQ